MSRQAKGGAVINKGRLALLIAACSLLFTLASPAFAEEPALPGGEEQRDKRPSGLFFSGAAHYYIAPGKPFTKPFPGARLGGGWEFPLGPGSLALGLEAGWTYTGLTGQFHTSENAHLIPLSLRAGYGIPLRSFILRLDALAGGFVSVLKVTGETHFSLFTGARLGAEYRLSRPLSGVEWSVFAGGGTDLLLQDGECIVLPTAEAGIKLRIQSREERARLKAERQEAALLEAERLEAERLEAERLEAERLEAERLEAERLEAERLEAERLEAERQERARQETARLEAERQERARQEAAWQEEAIRQGAALQEAARQEAERREVTPQEAARRETAALRELMTEVPSASAVESRGGHIALLTIWLPGNIASIPAAERAKLEAAAEFLRTVPNAQLIVADHAASTGNDEQECLVISRERARAVAEILVQNGVEADRIEEQAFGNAFPIAPNNTAAGRVRNRRVELILITGNAQ